MSVFIAGCGPSTPDDVEAFSNDPDSVKQGYMLSIGVPAAWKLALEHGGALVAIVDNGVDTTHPDLRNKIWTNPAEVENGLDDDGDGRIDDLHGWNFLDDTSDIGISSESSDHRAHGTAVAGIIAAETDNSVGIAACCPACQLMVLKARDFEDEHTVMPRLAAAIDYAAAHGARVVNISDGALPESLDASVEAEVNAAIESAATKGVVVVASAGNDGRQVVRWPAKVPKVIAVSAVDWEGEPASWTSYGPEVDVSAPGVFIWSTVPGGGYDYFEGTSASVPVVSALAALIMAAQPEWSVDQVTARLRDTARPAASGAAEIDFAAAMKEISP